MTVLLKRIANSISYLNEQVGKASAWLILALVLVVGFDVIARKLFNFTKVWIMDLEWHLFALIFLMAAGSALRHEKHVRVDLFYAEYNEKDKATTDFWGTLVFLIPWCLAVIYYSFNYAMDSFRMNEGAAEPGGLPARYLIKFAIVAGIILLLLQAIAMLIETGLILFSGKSRHKSDSTNESML